MDIVQKADFDLIKAQELAEMFWEKYDMKISSCILGPKNIETIIAPISPIPGKTPSSGSVEFTPKKILFWKVPLDEGGKEEEENAEYILRADYSDTIDRLVLWSLDDRSDS